MLEHTKKLRIEPAIEAKFRGSAAAISRLRQMAQEIGIEDTSDTVPWREAFPEYRDNLPGSILRGSRYKEGLTQKQLSALTGIPQSHISEMEHGKRPIGKTTARKLAAVFRCSYRIFL
ncbi:MAG: helix-turn-helix transcriptional regulator [Thermodesulfobacteriota bacterium]